MQLALHLKGKIICRGNLMVASKTFGFLAFMAIALGIAAPAGAAIIYDNAPPAVGGSGNESTLWLQAQSFSLATPTTVTGADIYIAGLGDISNWDGSYQFFFFANNLGSPGTQIATGTATTGSVSDTGIAWCCGGDAWIIAATFGAGINLGAGDYFFGIHLAADYTNRDEIYWVVSSIDDGRPGVESFEGTQNNWIGNAAGHAYTLYGTPVTETPVPEPSTLGLIGLGLLGLARLAAPRKRLWDKVD